MESQNPILNESSTKPQNGHQNSQKTCQIWVAVFYNYIGSKAWSHNQYLAKGTETMILINKIQSEKYKIVFYDKKNKIYL